ncbi:uncharacterized protein LOC115068330 [Nannospalax galili]|uniref:uncharacterized protein LOC115068330 n=1 Tax=Nannospalax galili TaxID=1026970 RepID=UPI00111C47FD|nr:uncharacterized protein LOC115068330 [Nannospalax galili]
MEKSAGRLSLDLHSCLRTARPMQPRSTTRNEASDTPTGRAERGWFPPLHTPRCFILMQTSPGTSTSPSKGRREPGVRSSLLLIPPLTLQPRTSRGEAKTQPGSSRAAPSAELVCGTREQTVPEPPPSPARVRVPPRCRRRVRAWGRGCRLGPTVLENKARRRLRPRELFSVSAPRSLRRLLTEPSTRQAMAAKEQEVTTWTRDFEGVQGRRLLPPRVPSPASGHPLPPAFQVAAWHSDPCWRGQSPSPPAQWTGVTSCTLFCCFLLVLQSSGTLSTKNILVQRGTSSLSKIPRTSLEQCAACLLSLLTCIFCPGP